MRSFLRVFLAGMTIGSFLLLPGCSTPPRSETSIPKPEISIHVASLDFASVNRRLEKKDVVQLAKVLKTEQIDILAVHGLVRYPSLAARVDLLTELASQADLRTAFGEMMNNSGRQTGNAVFSAFPIQSFHSQPFEGIRSASDEAALRATVDAGIHSVSIICAELPNKASADELAQCARIIQSLDRQLPVIATGNLPATVPVGMAHAPVDISSGRTSPSNVIWYTTGVLKPTSVRAVSTDLGVLLVARFEVFRTAQP